MALVQSPDRLGQLLRALVDELVLAGLDDKRGADPVSVALRFHAAALLSIRIRQETPERQGIAANIQVRANASDPDYADRGIVNVRSIQRFLSANAKAKRVIATVFACVEENLTPAFIRYRDERARPPGDPSLPGYLTPGQLAARPTVAQVLVARGMLQSGIERHLARAALIPQVQGGRAFANVNDLQALETQRPELWSRIAALFQQEWAACLDSHALVSQTLVNYIRLSQPPDRHDTVTQVRLVAWALSADCATLGTASIDKGTLEAHLRQQGWQHLPADFRGRITERRQLPWALRRFRAFSTVAEDLCALARRMAQILSIDLAAGGFLDRGSHRCKAFWMQVALQLDETHVAMLRAELRNSWMFTQRHLASAHCT
jgi:hypothetical protein